MGSSPCRRIHLLGITQSIVGKYFQELEVHRGMKHIQDLSCKKFQNLALLCFVKFWAENPVSFVYVNEKFYNKNLFRLVQYCVGKFSQILYCLYKMYRDRSIEFIEFRVFRKKNKKKKGWKCRKGPEGLLPIFGFGL